jgi:hypothetical protein
MDPSNGHGGGYRGVEVTDGAEPALSSSGLMAVNPQDDRRRGGGGRDRDGCVLVATIAAMLMHVDDFHRRDRHRERDRDVKKERTRRSRSRSRSTHKRVSRSKSKSGSPPPRPAGRRRKTLFDVAPTGGVGVPGAVPGITNPAVVAPLAPVPVPIIAPILPPTLASGFSAPITLGGGAAPFVQPPSQQATRHARRVYVGGLPPSANEQSIAYFFSNALAAVGGNSAGPGTATNDCQCSNQCCALLASAR